MKSILKKLFAYFLFILFPFLAVAQSKDKPKDNWQNLDLKSDGVFGISTEKAYLLLEKIKPQIVVVAVIDGGIDTAHEDLKDILWKNSKETPGNNLDDDGNGYVDDISGWNFIGSAKGNVQYDNLELVRLIRKFKPKYESALNSTPFTLEERKEFELYQRLVTDYMSQLDEAQSNFEYLGFLKKTIEEIIGKIGAQPSSVSDFEKYNVANDTEERVVKFVKSALKDEPDFGKFYDELKDAYSYFDVKIKYQLNLDYEAREIVGDNYANSFDRFYGNSDVMGLDAEHGTHVAGIIGAKRNNNLGINGVADAVRIMALRVVPDGDERDKDVANAIRYAVDNGAQIINMSFGKSYVWDKAVVDSAVKYAQLNGVLLIHAAGNDAKNTDVAKNYPTRFYTDSDNLNTGSAPLWIEVGASGWENDENLAARFSNYGKKSVDVFAPGVKINSTIPNSKYKENDGTSMAAPVVSGLAALLRAYFPKLSALEIKDIIIKSVVPVSQKVRVKSEEGNLRLTFDDLSSSGGVVNAYRAVEMALKRNNRLN